MKVCITGSSSGLGLEIKDLFINKGFKIESFDRSNGHDLDKNLEGFLSTDFDIYINNAHCGFKQVELLYKLWELNSNRACSIVNIGSISSDGNKDYVNNYAVEKSALEKACTQLQLINSDGLPIKVILIKLGRMETSMTADIKDLPKHDPKHIAEIIEWLTEQPNNMHIKSISVDVMNSMTKISR